MQPLSEHILTHGWFVRSHAQDGCTPLMEAVKQNDGKMALLLLENGADPETSDNVSGWECVAALLF